LSSAIASDSAQPVDRTVSWGVIGLLALATLGEGGGSVAGLFAWHLWLVVLLLYLVLRTSPVGRHGVERAPAIAFGLFAVLVGVNGALAPSALTAWLTLLELAAFGALAWLAARSGPALLAGAIWPLRVAGALHGGWAVIQRFVLDLPRPAGTFLDSNQRSCCWGWPMLCPSRRPGRGGPRSLSRCLRRRGSSCRAPVERCWPSSWPRHG